MTPFLVLLSAGLYALSFPPWKLGGLTWIALVPLVGALRHTRPAHGFLAGLLWGTAMIWAVGHWVPAALSTYWGQPAWFGFVSSFLGSVVFVGLYIGGFGLCVSLLSQRYAGSARCAAIAALWVAWEAARGHLLSGDPWLLIGYGLTPWPTWIQIGDVGGIYLVSLIVAYANACIAEVIFGRAQSARALATTSASLGALLLATYVYGAVRLRSDLANAPSATVAVIQGNNDLGSQWRKENYGKGLDDYLRLSQQAVAQGPVDLLVWPESAVTFFLAHEPAYQEVITRFLATADVELIVGAPHYEDRDPAQPQYYNSAFYMTAKNGVGGRYDKTHLLPFGEYFPLQTIGLLRRQFERVRTFTPGIADQLLETDLGKVAVVICFEAIFPDLVRRRMSAGAGLLVNLSNDAWLGGASGAAQHLAMIPMRAVENRTWVVRATTTGVSAVIDPHGHVVVRSEIGQEQILRAAVATRSSPTPYQRLGDVVAVLCVMVSVTLIATALVKRGSERRPS